MWCSERSADASLAVWMINHNVPYLHHLSFSSGCEAVGSDRSGLFYYFFCGFSGTRLLHWGNLQGGFGFQSTSGKPFTRCCLCERKSFFFQLLFTSSSYDGFTQSPSKNWHILSVSKPLTAADKTMFDAKNDTTNRDVLKSWLNYISILNVLVLGLVQRTRSEVVVQGDPLHGQGQTEALSPAAAE